MDIPLLQFAQALFVRLPPNTTSFCETLEFFLEARGYKLTTRVSAILCDQCMLTAVIPQETLRRRFGNSLLWYSSLTNALNRHIWGHLEASRDALRLLAAVGTSNRSPGGGMCLYSVLYVCLTLTD